MIISKWLCSACVTGLLSLGVSGAGAASVTYYFDNITQTDQSGSPKDWEVGAQFSVDVDSTVAGKVDFTFRNAVGVDIGTFVGLASSITDIYFYGELYVQAPMVLTSSTGVEFSEGAKPEELPGFKDLLVQFSADSESPTSHNGIDAEAEWLTIRFDIQPSSSLAVIQTAIEDGDFIVGIHVQAFTDNGSESFVTEGATGPGPNPIPLPASVWAGMALLGGLGLMKLNTRRRRLA